MARKLIIIIVLLSAAISGIIILKKIYKKFKHLSWKIDEVYSHLNNNSNVLDSLGYLHSLNAISFAKEQALINIINGESKNPAKDLCNVSIEWGVDKIQLSEAYLKCAKLDLQAGEMMRAIKNASYSLEANITTENKQFLSEMFSMPDARIVGTTQEISALEGIISSSDKNIAAAAHYRLALIYTPSIKNYDQTTGVDIDKAVFHQQQATNKAGIKQTKTTNISFIFNEKYSLFAANTILSILLNSDLENKYNFNIIYEESAPLSNITMNNIQKLKKIRDFDVTFIPFAEKIIENNKAVFDAITQSGNYPRILGLKLYLKDVLPKFDQNLQLDVDLLILRDLYELANTNLSHYNIAAAKTFASIKESKMFRGGDCPGLPAEYFNSGVIVQNFRENDEIEDISQVIEKTKCDYAFYDQCVLNLAAQGKTKFISPRWNTIFRNGELTITPTSEMPFIIHFTSIGKDFNRYSKTLKNNKEANPYLSLYFTYYDYAKGVFEGQ